MRTIVFRNVLKNLMSITNVWGDGGPWGGERFGAAQWGSGGEAVDTYWNTSYTDTSSWTTAYGAQWTEPYNTEIP